MSLAGDVYGEWKKHPIALPLAAAALVGVVYYVARRAVVETATAAAGVVTGNNVVTQTARTTAYEGKGILGTLGALFDHASAGSLSRVGEKIGGVLADTHERIFQ